MLLVLHFLFFCNYWFENNALMAPALVLMFWAKNATSATFLVCCNYFCENNVPMAPALVLIFWAKNAVSATFFVFVFCNYWCENNAPMVLIGVLRWLQVALVPPGLDGQCFSVLLYQCPPNIHWPPPYICMASGQWPPLGIHIKRGSRGGSIF